MLHYHAADIHESGVLREFDKEVSNRISLSGMQGGHEGIITTDIGTSGERSWSICQFRCVDKV